MLMEINKKLCELPEIKQKLDILFQVKETVESMEKSVQHLSDQYDEVLAKMQLQSTEIVTLSKRVEKIEAQIQSENTNPEICELRQQINSLEQYSRRNNLEVHGLAQTKNENLFQKINAIAQDLELPQLTEHDVEGLHRLPAKRGKTPAVLVRFSSRVTKDQWMEKKQSMREAESTVYFLDNLTAQNKRLIWMMKTRATEKQYEYAWHSNGKLFVRKCQGETAIRIACVADLENII
ncbi:uncharacterized protein LOC144110852 [Amblyomma americanum]